MVSYSNNCDTWSSWTWECPSVTTTASQVWHAWTANCPTTTSTQYGCPEVLIGSAKEVWVRWTSADGTIEYRQVIPAHSDLPVASPAEPTKEELELRAKQAEERAERARLRLEEAEKKRLEEEKRRKHAEQRAKKLLLQCLNLEQKLDYVRNRGFNVVSPSGRTYRLRHGWAGNVDELGKEGKPINRLCIHPKEEVPIPDNLLTQKLLLESDEERFRKTANHSQPTTLTAN